MRRLLPFLVFLALAALLLAGVLMSGRENREAIASPLVGKPAPDFALPMLHEPERQVALSDLRGAPFLLNVWGSWCPACRDEHAVITDIAERNRIRVVGFNWRDERDEALRWLRQFGDSYHLIVVDEVGQTAIEWGVYGAPETFLVDAEGVIRWKYVGPLTPTVVENELRPRLAELGVTL